MDHGPGGSGRDTDACVWKPSPTPSLSSTPPTPAPLPRASAFPPPPPLAAAPAPVPPVPPDPPALPPPTAGRPGRRLAKIEFVKPSATDTDALGESGSLASLMPAHALGCACCAFRVVGGAAFTFPPLSLSDGVDSRQRTVFEHLQGGPVTSQSPIIHLGGLGRGSGKSAAPQQFISPHALPRQGFPRSMQGSAASAPPPEHVPHSRVQQYSPNCTPPSWSHVRYTDIARLRPSPSASPST